MLAKLGSPICGAILEGNFFHLCHVFCGTATLSLCPTVSSGKYDGRIVDAAFRSSPALTCCMSRSRQSGLPFQIAPIVHALSLTYSSGRPNVERTQYSPSTWSTQCSRPSALWLTPFLPTHCNAGVSSTAPCVLLERYDPMDSRSVRPAYNWVDFNISLEP
jgi:hypothetical protein